MDTIFNSPTSTADALREPRKPRPSEIAAKKARKVKKGAKKVKKPTAKRLKTVKAKRKPGKPKVKRPVPERSERLDFRLTKSEKARVLAKAAKAKRTVSSLFVEFINKK